MKRRSLALFFLCLMCVTILLFLYGDSQPSINHFVSQTQEKINEWKNGQVFEITKADLDPAEKYLTDLGFHKNPVVYPDHTWNAPLPVIVSAVSSDDVKLISGFVKSFLYYLPNNILVLYALGLRPAELSQANGFCNSTNCGVRHFNFQSYPPHVQDLKLSAFRPIIIQEVLNEAGVVLWLDIHYVFTSDNIGSIMKQAEKEGVISWSINHPTSALTHPRMFDFFHTNQENFIFHRMIQPNHILLYNFYIIHSQLMKPWVRCALVLNCIAPIGAQSTGCRFDKKPLFRYSGCHRYDMSALNVALGIMFDYSSTHYIAKDEDRFFQYTESDVNTVFDRDYVKNTSMFSDV